MASKLGKNDVYANMAYLQVTETGANTLTFAQLQLANTLMTQKTALIIHRLDVFPDLNATALSATNKSLGVALTLTNKITSINDQSQPEVLFFRQYKRIDFGAAASGMIVPEPEIVDYNYMPGGGIIVPADRLYIGVAGIGAGAAQTCSMRIYYTVKELETSDYWELIEARRIMTT